MKKIVSFLLMFSIVIFSLIFLSPSYLFAIPSQFADNGHYYEVIETPEFGGKTWTEAKSAAGVLTYNDGLHTYGGHLATITDPDEQAFVTSLISQVSYDCWIGGYQDSQDPGFAEPAGGWNWITGELWSYSNWDTDEPNDGAGAEDNQENYALMKTTGYWNDLDNRLFFTGGYIVEYDILLQDKVTIDIGIEEKTSTVKSQLRIHPMTCWQVYVNEANNFEFIFWWLYGSNNWVKIYDMEDNLVFEKDLDMESPYLK